MATAYVEENSKALCFAKETKPIEINYPSAAA
jgi:hypothetical protein